MATLQHRLTGYPSIDDPAAKKVLPNISRTEMFIEFKIITTCVPTYIVNRKRYVHVDHRQFLFFLLNTFWSNAAAYGRGDKYLYTPSDII